MCGVFGYLGRSGNAAREVIAGLQRLEYRGYDSAGLCVINHERDIQVIKSVGKVGNLKMKSESIDMTSYHVGIGHTRWATHGGVTEANCHPHISGSGRFVVIHNGIIENYAELKAELIGKGYSFYSETDTEITVKLFEDVFDGDHLSTMKKIIARMQGAYGLVFLDREHPDRIFGTKKGSPMVLGFKNAPLSRGEGAERPGGLVSESREQNPSALWASPLNRGASETFISSDYRSLIGLIDDYIILEDGDIFLITPEEYTILAGESEIERMRHIVDESEKPIELGDFPHFMLKEIFDQPKVIEDVFRGRINFETHELHSDTLDHISTLGIEKITIVASGTSYHSGLVGKYFLEEYADLPVEVNVSAEFKYKKKFIDPKTLFIFVSQSGETADALDSLKMVKEQGGNVFGIVNVPGSSIARIAEQGLFTRAGTEIGVASTKAFTAQVACFLFLALYLGKRKNLDYRKYREILEGLAALPERMQEILRSGEGIRQVAEKYASYGNFFFLGRALEFPIAMEGSLKLKEISYIHSETYASGELKHGSIALIDENFPTIMVNGGGPLYGKNTSSVQEVKARKGKVIGVIAETDPKKDMYDSVLTFPHLHEELNIFLEVIALQLFSYYMALHLGREIDKPRNLAKSVTVE